MAERLFNAWRTAEDCAARVDESLRFMRKLYPICRSITGSGVRETLRLIGERIPLTLTEVPSGRVVFDWEVPNEWNIRSAWIKDPDGRTVVDFADHNLHVVSYSTPIDAMLSLEELLPHLHSMPAHPQWIPYRTSYYKETWGFCLRHETLAALKPGDYRVHIDSTLAPGNLTFAESVVPGETEEEFLIFTHVCHPSLCNDNLTGMAIAAELAERLHASRPRLTYRFVFAPGTIGSIVWLALREEQVHRVRDGLVLGLLGDVGPLTYKRSRRQNAEIDTIAEYVITRQFPQSRIVDFSPYGYDERQLCSPGFDLPVGRLTRSPNDGYAQYHSSADDFSIIDSRAMSESLFACAEILKIADRNVRYLNLNPKCEPRLGKHGLYRSVGGVNPGEFEHALLWILNQSDGSNDLVEIAKRSGLPIDSIFKGADALLESGLLRVADEKNARKRQ